MSTIGTQFAAKLVMIARTHGMTDTDIATITGHTVETLADAAESEKVQIVRALQSAVPLAPVPASRPAKSGQSGRCLSCGATLDRLSAGGYCHDCQ